MGAESGAVLAADIYIGQGSSLPSGFTMFDGEMYFSATDVTHGREVWKVKADGTVALAFDIDPGTANSRAENISPIDGPKMPPDPLASIQTTFFL